MNKIYIFIFAILAVSVTACSSWNDDESIDIKTPEKGDYGKYLERLREYKTTDHQAILAWFDNSTKVTTSRSHHMSDIPDSVDIAILTSPTDLVGFEVEDMRSLQQQKGTKVLLPIDFDQMQSIYDAEDSTIESSFEEYVKTEVESLLATVKKYEYDGIAIGYKGKNTIYMTAETKSNYLNRQNIFLTAINGYFSQSSSQFAVFYGNPQFLESKTILPLCKHIIINTLGVSSADGLSIAISQASVADVPTDRFSVMVNTASLDAGDKNTGYFGAERAIVSAANWVTEGNNVYKKTGLAINNIQNDYFNPTHRYLYSRQAINIINPAPLK